MSMGGADRITTVNILINVSASFAVGMFIFFIYRKTYQGVLYQRSFNVSLVLSGVVTSLVIMTISGNLVLSLGMVGALSIVRFRTPVKDSMDLVFLFWAISAGIANGVGYFNISIIGSVLIAIFLLGLTRYGDSASNAYLLVVELSNPAKEASVLEQINQNVDMATVKTKTVSDGISELTLELRVRGGDTTFINRLQEGGDVTKATLIAYEQDMSVV